MLEINNEYKIIYYALIVAGLNTIYLAVYSPRGNIGLAVFFIVSLCCIASLKCSIQIFKTLRGNLPIIPFLLGFLLVISGTLFDVINTVIYSADLSLEANPIARLLLDMNYSVNQVYFIGSIGQILFISMFTMLWASFLKAYPIVLQNIPKRSFWKTIVPLFAGPKATLIEFIIGKVDPFFGITALTPILVSLYLYRWYLGFEWMGWVPISRMVVPMVIILVTFFSYTYISFRRIQRS